MNTAVEAPFDGPYGMTQVQLMRVAVAVAPPLNARRQLLVMGAGSKPSEPRRLIAVYDAHSATVADAWMPLGASVEEQLTAAQWLLDLCCTRYGVEGMCVEDKAEIKIS